MSHLKDKATEEASALSMKGRDAISTAAAKTRDVASSTLQMAEGAVDTVGGEMKSLASSIREKAPVGGMFGNAASGVANTLESGGAYLQERNLHGLGGDATNLIRRYPLQALLLGLGVGFLVGRIVRR
ncbi:MAG TPA: hypothetical protein VK395_32515 [Gemmataceae bacterium]|nr:hypothetical protein [Gemmataceae bacterium]